MVLVTSNKAKRLLCVSYIGQVRPGDLAQNEEDIKALMAELLPDFRMLVDFSALDSMGLDCLPEIDRMMDLIGQRGVGLIVRVIPDPKKDIGFNIFSIFHYSRDQKIFTCANMPEAVKYLGISLPTGTRI
jgi:anti-anti-sigma regulatory factor